MMNNNSREAQIIREYVAIILHENMQKALNEDDGGFGYGMGGSEAMGQYGVHYASGDQMYNTFIKPFVDVVKVTAGKTKEMSQRAQTLAKVAFESVATSLLPWLSSDYGDIFKREAEEINKIRSEYGDVYAATWDAFKDKDVALTAFFCYPGAILTGLFAKKTPKVALNMLSVISGGEMDGVIDNIKDSISSGFGKSKGRKTFSSPGGDKTPWMESLIREDKDKEKTKKQKLADIVTNEKLVNKALSTPLAQRLQKEAQEAMKNTLKQVFERAQAVMTSKTLDELQKKIGKPLKGLDKLKSIKPEEKAEAEKQLLDNLRKSMKEFYAKSLEQQVKDAVGAGIPKNSQFVFDYVEVIRKIRAL